jgi:argininosuccinate lyase
MAKSGKSSKSGESEKSWQGRLTADADAATSELVTSLDVDIALWKYDIAGSIAHAEMLSQAGIITAAEFEKIRRGLLEISEDIQDGKLAMPVELEDIHMVIEKALIDRTGDAGAKLHTGRSRNDQVATDLRLWARDAADQLIADVRKLQRALCQFALRDGQIVMPAYTHLQRAQPILSGQAILAYVEMLDRDAQRLSDARRRINVSPLGSGAVAGSSLNLDRTKTARLLGFADISRNSIDATSDRDFLAELCFACSLLAVHLSRWAEDWIIYSTTEFGFIILNDAYCTSSSMMPQKKNPDTLELIRAKSATAIANLVGMLTLLKGLPLAYNRDLQDDKRFAFASVKAMRQVLAVAKGIAETTKLDAGRITRDLDQGFLDATALAEYLVGKGVPFRHAHHSVAQLVAQADRDGLTLSQLPLGTLQSACKKVQADVYDHLGPANVVEHYAPQGSAGVKQLKAQLAFWCKRLRC